MLNDKVALVTGGSRGIGKAICMELAQRGACIAVCDIDFDGAKETAEELKKMGFKAAAFKVNVSDFDEAQQAVKGIVKEFGKVDILVNNAGVTRDNLIMRMKPEEWDLVISVNLKGAFNLTKAVTRPMMKARYGRIINVASVVGLQGNAGQANYSASKAGMIGLTKSTAQEFASRNITVNAVAPGFIETEMTKVLSEEVIEQFLQGTPLKRAGKPEDVARVIAFLASDDAAFVTGEVIRIDGGMSM